MKRILSKNSGFTLIEVVMAIIIAGILAAVAMRSTISITESGKTEMTKTEMRDIAFAIAGNDNLQNNQIRNDFGYIGDVGSLPTNLDDLISNPGGYITWKGPYIINRFTQTANDYKQDAWGATYAYSGVDITSTGSGSQIVHKIGEATSDFTINQVTGNIYDSDGTPPGSIYKDSITVLLTYPNGAGGTFTKGITPDYGGYFSFDSIPIGNQDINIVYNPSNDTLKRFVSVTPKSALYDEYLLPSDYWNDTTVGGSGGGGGSGLTYVANSATTSQTGCDRVEFEIINNSGSAITLTSITVSWSTPTAFYRSIKFGNPTVVNQMNPQVATDQIANFNSSQIIANGETIIVRIDQFEDSDFSGSPINMANTDFTITFSDGSIITFTSGGCL